MSLLDRRQVHEAPLLRRHRIRPAQVGTSDVRYSWRARPRAVDREGRARFPSVCTALFSRYTPVLRYGRGRCPRLLMAVAGVPRTATGRPHRSKTVAAESG